MPIEIFSRIKDGSLKHVSGADNNTKIGYNYKKRKYEYKINKLWNNGETNEEIHHELMSRSDDYEKIYYVAFGYTGSGKTYTIYGILKELLLAIQSVGEEIRVSAFQIYGNNIYDMLNENEKLKIYKTENLIIHDLTEETLIDKDTFIHQIKHNRKLACTNLNDVSSRSHAIINIYHGFKHYLLIDMSGQESGVTGTNNAKLIQKQGRDINLDMLALKECIRNHYNKNKFIPFRRCLLTLALKPMFMSNCYTAFICTISVKQGIYHQIDSLNYASSLYNNNSNKKMVKISEVFDKYTEYINENGWVGCQERELWRQMRKGNYKNKHKIREYLNRKQKIFSTFNKILLGYEKIHP